MEARHAHLRLGGLCTVYLSDFLLALGKVRAESLEQVLALTHVTLEIIDIFGHCID
jgi:hypothetical protein